MFFREFCWGKVFFRVSLGLAFEVGSSFSGGLGWVSWWFRVGLGCFFAQNVSLGPWALDSLGFVAYEEAGGLGGRSRLHRNMGERSHQPKIQKAKRR